MIGAWPLIMGVTMWLQQKLNPQPPDPIQAKLFMILPVVFTFMLAHFPAGLVIYWTWNNLLSILQQWVIMRRMGVDLRYGQPVSSPVMRGFVPRAHVFHVAPRPRASVDGRDELSHDVIRLREMTLEPSRTAAAEPMPPKRSNAAGGCSRRNAGSSPVRRRLNRSLRADCRSSASPAVPMSANRA